jgi:hypothetical protein
MMSDMDSYIVACGATAVFDTDSGFSYRCTECGAVIGSVGMPAACKEAEEKVKMWEILNGTEKR